jgi:hypothetical protein
VLLSVVEVEAAQAIQTALNVAGVGTLSRRLPGGLSTVPLNNYCNDDSDANNNNNAGALSGGEWAAVARARALWGPYLGHRLASCAPR